MGISKSELRKKMLEDRGNLSLSDREKASIEIKDKVVKNRFVMAAERVFLFASIKSEVSTDLLIDELISMGKKIALPRVINDEIEFFLIESRYDLAPGTMNIPEPPAEITRKVVPERGDVMILPGAVFDTHGNRIGYGGGFYDRYIAAHRKAHAYKIGICYKIQLLDKRLPTNLHDNRVDAVITEDFSTDFERKTGILGALESVGDFVEDVVYQLLS